VVGALSEIIAGYRFSSLPVATLETIVSAFARLALPGFLPHHVKVMDLGLVTGFVRAAIAFGNCRGPVAAQPRFVGCHVS
jgi:hypothetical protein